MGLWPPSGIVRIQVRSPTKIASSSRLCQHEQFDPRGVCSREGHLGDRIGLSSLPGGYQVRERLRLCTEVYQFVH